MMLCCFFFKQKTAYEMRISDWSSDVCSSDLDLGIDKYTYQEVKERQLNLGLDLKGGMNVTLEVSLSELVRALANYSEDPVFDQAIKQAQEQTVSRSEERRVG